MPAANPLSYHYLEEPDCIGQLGRLTKILKGKYAQLHVIDVGANVGDTASIIKSSEDVPLVCIEGDAFTFKFLKKNVSRFTNTSAHNLYMGEKTELIAANFEKSGWNTTIMPSKSPSAKTIQLTSIDDFMDKQPHQDKYKLLKIDTEGFDCSIIRGAQQFAKNVSPVIAFEYNRENMDAIGEQGLNTFGLLENLGYSQIFFHDPIGRFLLSTSLAEHDLIRHLHEYADGKRGGIAYYDITVFHKSDDDLAIKYLKEECSRRAFGGSNTFVK